MTFPPLVEFVDELLQALEMTPLTYRERSFIHRVWKGQHDSADDGYAADYVQRVLHWRDTH